MGVSIDRCISDIFTLTAVSVIKIFLVQVTNQTLCCPFNNTVVSKSSIFLLYITPLNLFHKQSFENCISGSILPNS